MRRLATSMLGLTALLCTVATAFAVPYKYPPGPPFRTCPGTPTPYTVQNPDTIANPCYPVIGDTVVSVGGIIIGFDAKPSAYAVYFQNSAGGAFSGVQAFTGATNYNASPYNLALGDSITVTGTCQEFPNPDGTTEIEGPDVIQSTNDIIITKLTSNNALPAFKILTPAQINWIPSVSQGEQWEATLVRVKGPLKVVRRVTSGTLAGLTANTFLLKLASVPDGVATDSVMIDGNTLTTFTPPALNTVIDSIQGIVNQGNGGTINSYRIQLRDADDIFGPFAPGLADAYCIEDNQLRLIFDRKVDVASAQNTGNYSLASGIDGSTVDLATVEAGGKSVRLNITTVRNHGDVETVSAVNIGSATCPGCVITPQQSRTFIQGVLSCAEVQAPLAANLPIFDDRSRFAGTGTLPGTKMTVRGVGTGQYGTLQYIGDAAGGFRAGVSVFGPLQPLTPGRKFRIAGQVQEFGGETEVVSTTEITDEGAASLPPATLQTVAVLRDTVTDQTQTKLTGEDYEGVLVKVSYVKVTENRTIGQSFFAAGPNPSFTDTILVSNLNGVLNSYLPPDSNSVCDITGILHQSSGTYRICPRDPSDIVVHGHNVGVPPMGTELSFAVAPNPASRAHITFVLPRATDVSLGVFDLQGRQVASLASGRLPAGSYTKEWRPSASQMKGGSGVYFYRLKAGSETRVVRGVIIN